MRLPPNFTVKLTGDTLSIVKRSNADQGHLFAYLMARLFAGLDVADDAFEAFGLKVEIEEAEQPKP
jgi:hypothetical protein